MRWVTATYCDDVRTEHDGRQSLMGVYRGVLFVPSVPVSIGKLCIVVRCTTPDNKPFDALTCRLFFNDDLIGESSHNIVPAPAPPKLGHAPKDLEQRLTTEFHIIFSPLHVETEGVLRLRVDSSDGETFKGNGLTVCLWKPNE